ncbi:hydroxyethylthiazole kinase [Ureibacillus sinduriensis]|uniref:Hydroxyethylthiazole kinase n=1 Tax=Ureibacillus sinduriensis BLB-1 = JCM 15800 TaxID=1384057 RepID=A0A0A3HVR0_9BACL|nr:hydroxyethylthiazole kinase [Ureibacillus sinduriensis]KGR75275.1 hydroxyethylthiazole kinase [Ureibacillus sinduriensis BLB-1 = JCM 15800]
MLAKINQTKPLVHCITNYVVANFTANGLLAIGASPVMADEAEDAAAMVAIANALLLNIGTVNARTHDAMLVAGRKANECEVPVVLDPVGVGATPYRKSVVMQLLEQVSIDVLRCNEGELASIHGVTWESRGVDSGNGEMDTIAAAKEVARKYECIVVVTGATDIVTDGQEIMQVQGGNIHATHITGTGCLLSAICAAVLACSEKPLQNLASALKEYKIASEQSGTELGMFPAHFINTLQRIAEGRL